MNGQVSKPAWVSHQDDLGRRMGVQVCCEDSRWNYVVMRKLLLIPVVLSLGPLAGCVVAPVRHVPPPGVYYVAPPGVAYVAPTYVVPGPGYVWAYNMRFGWGWHHPRLGWHQGWH